MTLIQSNILAFMYSYSFKPINIATCKKMMRPENSISLLIQYHSSDGGYLKKKKIIIKYNIKQAQAVKLINKYTNLKTKLSQLPPMYPTRIEGRAALAQSNTIYRP